MIMSSPLSLQHGVLRTKSGDYFIEPIKGHDYKNGGEHPHIVYRRSALPDELDILRAHLSDKHHHQTCGVHGESIILQLKLKSNK